MTQPVPDPPTSLWLCANVRIYFCCIWQDNNVSIAAEVSACAALQNPTYLENVKDALLQERERLYHLLKELPLLKPYPSYSNFILCEVTSGRMLRNSRRTLQIWV